MPAPTRQKATALSLAALYAALAMAGQALHELTHCSDGSCELVAHTHGTGHSCGSPHSCCEHESPDGSTDDGSQTAFRAPGVEGHDPHSCGVCSLLAQMKVGHGTAAAETMISAALADSVLTLPPAIASDEEASLGPRGPPAIG